MTHAVIGGRGTPGVEYTPEMLAMLEAQRQHFASDDHIRREVEVLQPVPLPDDTIQILMALRQSLAE